MRSPSFCLVSLYNLEAMGLRSLHSTLVNAGFDTKMIFLKSDQRTREEQLVSSPNPITDKEIELFTDQVSILNPDIVGFSLVSAHVPIVKKLADYLYFMRYKGKILLGGIHPTILPEDSIQFSDMICRGEGEQPILDLAYCLSEGRDPYKLNNFWFNEDDVQIKNEMRARTKYLDQNPVPIFRDEDCYIIDNDIMAHKDPYRENTRYGIMVFRGCTFKCSYCCSSYLSKLYNGPKLRGRSPEHILSELIKVKKELPKIECINFYDEVFSIAWPMLPEFLEQYKKLINLPFYCEFYPGLVKEEVLIKLKDAGLKGVWLGVQSGSERTRREVFFRNYTNDIVLRDANLFHKHNISVRYDFILDNPFETLEDKLDTISLMMKLPLPYTTNLFSLSWFPNTEITQMALERGYITEDDIEGKKQKSFNNWVVRLDDKSKSEEDIFIDSMANMIAYSASKGSIPEQWINDNIIALMETNDLQSLWV